MMWLERFLYAADRWMGWMVPRTSAASTHGSTRTGQRTPPRPLPDDTSIAGQGTAGSSWDMTPMSATDAEQSWVWPSALSAVTLPAPGSRESAREWADCLLSLAVVIQEESTEGPFKYGTDRLLLASAEFRRWADEET